MTVEATMVFAMVLTVMMYIIYGMFFVYDRCLMDQDAAMLAIRGGGRTELGKKATAQYVKAENVKLAKDEKYVAWQEAETTITLKKDKVNVTKQGRLRFHSLWDWEGKSVATSTKTDPTFFIRSCRKIIEYGGRESGD